MSANPIKRYVSYPLQTVLVRILLVVFRLLGLDRASAFGGWLARKIGPMLGKAKTARKNLTMAFPEKSEAEIAEIETAMWDNLGRVIAEYAHLDRLFEEAEQRVELDIAPEADRVIMPEAPLVGVSAHIANWEVIGAVGLMTGLDMGVIYREPNNPHIRDLLKRQRGNISNKLFSKSAEGARAAMQHLRGGGMVGALIDQRFNKGAPIEFFGQPAMTATALAQMAIRSNAPFIVVLLERLDGANFRITVPPPIPVPLDLNRQEAAIEMTRQATEQLEALIRKNPGQWLWIHNRWKGRQKNWN